MHDDENNSALIFYHLFFSVLYGLVGFILGAIFI